MSDYRPGPETVAAEAAWLGCLLILHNPAKIIPLLPLLPVEDLWQPKHQTVAEAVADLVLSGRPCDPITVYDEIRRRGETGTVDAPYLHTLTTLVPSTELAPTYARQVTDTARRRRAVDMVTRAQQALVTATVDVDETMLDLAVSVEVALAGKAKEYEPPPDLETFLAAERGYRWLVPDMIERGDRFLLTGSEGAGKSHWLRQMACCFAGGIHPFAGGEIKPVRVLMVDCENSTPHLSRQLRKVAEQVVKLGGNPKRNLFVDSRPAGLDLTTVEDTGTLTDMCAAVRPDVLVIGPLYRLYTGNASDEENARAVSAALDRVRTRHDCALLMEAHSPHGETGNRALRPSGSSLWLRWPEFGYGLRLRKDEGYMDLESWRGQRDERMWPAHLKRGGENKLPFVEHVPGVR